jgi:hypothetical protein
VICDRIAAGGVTKRRRHDLENTRAMDEAVIRGDDSERRVGSEQLID